MLKNLFYKPEAEETDNYYQALKAFKIDPNQDLNRVKSRIGLEASVSYAHLYFSNQKSFKRLRRELDLHQNEFNQLNSQYDVLIVLPPKALMNRKIGQKVLHQCSGLAVTAGFAYVSHAQLNSDNALEGARRLTRLVEEKRRQGRKLLLVSFSYGSAFVRIMLDNMEKESCDHIKGWLNLSGLIFGSPRFHCSDKKRFYQRVSLAMRSFSSEQKYFQGPLDTKGIKTVHLLGLQSREAMNFSELKTREELKAWGPNDGLVPFAPYQKLNAPVMSLLNQGHHIDVGAIGSTYLRILSSMVSTIPVRGETLFRKNDQSPQFI